MVWKGLYLPGACVDIASNKPMGGVQATEVHFVSAGVVRITENALGGKVNGARRYVWHLVRLFKRIHEVLEVGGWVVGWVGGWVG